MSASSSGPTSQPVRYATARCDRPGADRVQPALARDCREMQHGVVFLPGIIAPAAVRYRALIEALRGVQASMHDLAVYDGETPPSGYSISTEIDALDRFADAAQLDQFHV